ncbi:hypothetical protein UFOVP296_5 [uncultured Caudovirales phage]|uniref:DUF7227 domain-containing protein n=1 Tax=uncultured Caudovirales phage TaxID=2100421 RepID=A0A6J5RNX0_9CAUD|nr:hypothetical protein UFOVP296_5 [uncultured Caudovirales phage]CAB4169976.1 hypothetical protein UFOVP912_24 [uncultured Caudovirales phage]CAB4199073.1 hypothetical protein UFOVP1334_12 [uncultured Caudovirales phage]
MTRVHLTKVSNNAKTGPIPVTTSEEKTCPASCPLKGGCYAKSGPLALHWRRVSSGERGISWDELCGEVARFPVGQLWRHNQAGDLPGEGEEVNVAQLRQLVEANRGRKGFTYSHKSSPSALLAIAEANLGGFTINLSANNLSHADELLASGAGPVVVILPSDTTRNTTTPKGARVIICPATQREGVTCASCTLCQKSARAYVIGFPAHGTGKRKASAIAGGAE